MKYSLIKTLGLFLICGTLLPAAEISFDTRNPGTITACVGDQPVADYVYANGRINRPYIWNVRTTDGIQVSRDYPPVEGRERTDHSLIHPGIWMSFKEIGGLNFWHGENHCFTAVIEKASVVDGVGSFTVENLYCEGDDKATARVRETCRLRFLVMEGGWLLIWESAFRGLVDDAVFGDQEEMGLGIRVATEISGVKGGRILNSNGRRTEKEAWGKTADWCDYSGRMDGGWVGMAILAGNDNFRRSWFHARDYGLLLANPFGRQAFQAGPRSEVKISRDTPLRLTFGVYIHSAEEEHDTDIAALYREFSPLTRHESR